MSNSIYEIHGKTTNNDQNNADTGSLKNIHYVNLFADCEVEKGKDTSNPPHINIEKMQNEQTDKSSNTFEIKSGSNSETTSNKPIVDLVELKEEMSIEEQLQLIQIQQQLLFLQQQELLLRYRSEQGKKDSNCNTFTEAIPNDESAMDTTHKDDLWMEAKAPNGKIYYFNKITKEISWTKPEMLIVESSSSELSPRNVEIESKDNQSKQTPSLIHSYSVVNVKSTDSNKPSQPQLLHFNSSPDLNSFINNTFLRIYLPDDQRQVVRFNANQTLRDVLRKVCMSRSFTEEDYIPKDKENNELNLDDNIGTIGKDEIYFLTPKGESKVNHDSKIKKLLAEILQSNSSLSISLFAVLKNYRDPLLESSREPDVKNRIISESQTTLIFTSIESIAKECKNFKQMLGPLLDQWPIDLEDTFRKHMDIIPYYSIYLNNLRDALDTLEELRKNPLFNSKVDAIQKVNATRLRLEDFIVLPASKICKMFNYVGELCKLVGDTHLNYMTLKEFHLRLSSHHDTAAAIFSEYESRKKLLHIQNVVHKIPKKVQLNLRSKFHKEGILGVQLKKNVKPTPVYVYLFTDFLFLCKYETKAKQTTYSFFDMISIVKNNTVVEDTSSTYGFNLNMEDSKKGRLTYIFNITSESTSTKLEWLVAFKEAIEECNRRN